jgi:hypothetical protein
MSLQHGKMSPFIVVFAMVPVPANPRHWLLRVERRSGPGQVRPVSSAGTPPSFSCSAQRLTDCRWTLTCRAASACVTPAQAIKIVPETRAVAILIRRREHIPRATVSTLKNPSDGTEVRAARAEENLEKEYPVEGLRNTP